MTRIDQQVPLFLGYAAASFLAVLSFDAETAVRFSGYGFGLPAPVFMLGVIVVGPLALWRISAKGFHRKRGGMRARKALALSLLFAVVAIAVDLLHPYPETINIRFPQSLLFYPSMALVAETVFHLVPLALLLAARVKPATAILIAALIEPVFQILAGETLLHWSTLVTAANIFAISFIGLHLFRVYGIAALLGFRLLYYLWWHLIWGEIRLPLLF